MAPTTYSSAGGTNPAVADDPTKKKPLNLPYMDQRSPNQILPLTNSSMVGNQQQNNQVQQVSPMQPQQPQVQQVDPATQQRNQAMSSLLSTANQPRQPSTINNLVNQQTEKLLQNPTQGWNGEQYKQTQLSNYDKDEAAAFEALRQQFADSADTGQFRKDSIQNQLNSLQNRRTLGSNIDYENRDYNKKSIIDALAEGRSTEQLNQNAENSTIDNMVKALQAGESDQQIKAVSAENEKARAQDVLLKNMDTEAQMAVTTLKGQIEQNLQVSDQTWKSAEEALNRQHDIAIQNGDIDGALRIEELKANLQEKYQQNREVFQRSERELSQIYNTSERLDVQNYETNMKYLDSQLEEIARTSDFNNTKEAMSIQAQIDEAKANGDLTRAQALEATKANQAETYAKNRAAEATIVAQKKFDYDWLMQNNDYTHDEKMVRLGAELEEAKANGDVAREQQLMTLQANIDFQKMQKDYGYEAALTNLRGSIDAAAASNDFNYATLLKGQEINATISENAKDRALQLSELALQQDQAAYQRYELMSQTDPEGAAKYLKTELAKKGISYNPVDAVEQAKKAVLADFEVAKEQWKVSHNGSLEGFNEFYNSSMYGDKTQDDYIDQIVSGQFNYQQLKSDPEKLAAAKENAIPWDQSAYKNKEGKNIMEFNTMPEMNVPFKTEYGSFVRVSDPTRKVEFGADRQQFQAINLINGNITTFTAV